MNQSTQQINIGDAIKVKGKIYFVFDVRKNYLLCRQYLFSKTGRFQRYQDHSFALSKCQLANPQEKQTINEQRIQASIQRKPYSPIADNFEKHLIR